MSRLWRTSSVTFSAMSSQSPPDLSVLSRTGGKDVAPAEVLRARSSFWTRAVLPALILCGALGLLGYLLMDVVLPRTEVRLATAVARSSIGAFESGGSVSGAGVQAPGWVEPDPYPISVPALADGVITEVLVLEGQKIEAGQVVARMVENDAALEVRDAEAMCDERAAEVDAAKAAVVRAKAELEAEQAEAAAQRDEIETKRNLTNPKSIGESRNRQSEIRLAGQDAKVKAAEAAVTEAEAMVSAAAGALRRAQVMHEAAKLKLERMKIRAPVGGVVLSRLVAPGSHVMLASMGEMAPEVVRLYDPSRLQVRVDVPLAEAGRVSVGQIAEVSTEAIPDRTFAGRVTRIVPEASMQKNTVQVKVSVESPDPQLRPEMLARVRFEPPARVQAPGGDAASSLGAEAVFIPVGALRGTEGERSTVWVYQEESSTAKQRQIRVGSVVVNGWRHVLEGVKEGERVLTLIPPGVTESTRLKVMENEGGGAS